jgi:hypothetical protein
LKGDQRIEKPNPMQKNFVLTKDKIGISSAELGWYTNIKNALEKDGIPIDDIPYCINYKNKKYRNKDLVKTLERINDKENLEKEIESIKRIRDMLVIDNQTMLKINSEYSDSLKFQNIIAGFFR